MAVMTKKGVGDAAEAQALAHLERHGLKRLERNYRVAGGPSARGGEIDLILRDKDGTVVFVEVRARHTGDQGGAASSVTPAKQRRVIFAARRYLSALASPPPCRFDVVTVEGNQLVWLKAAFEA